MKRRVAAAALAALVCVPLGSVANANEDVLDLVDPMIGTSGSGFVFPGPAAPFGMVQLSPDTEGPVAFTGYSYTDKMIRGFSHVHTQSMGVWEGGELPLMPTVGAVNSDVKQYQSRFNHAQEQAEVGSYQVTLGNGVDVELTAGLRTGMHRYRFPANEWSNIIIDAGRNVGNANMIGPDLQNDPGRIPAAVEVLQDGTVVGSIRENDRSNRGYTVFFAIRTNQPADQFGVFSSRGATPQDGIRNVAGTGAGAYLRFAPVASQREVVVSVGLSFVDRVGAIGNLESDTAAASFNFDELRNQTRAAWRDELSTITTSGGLLTDRISFATALYHAQHHPNVFDDADGRYMGYDFEVHKIGEPGDPIPAGSNYYANFSLWDTYRTQMPLLAWIQPERYAQMMRSLHAVALQGGRLPHWGWMNRYADFMNGNPALPAIADGICRGLLDQDLATSLLTDASLLALNEGPADTVRHRDPVYLEKGYVPMDVSGSGAASTLEYATNDFSLALAAHALGDQSRAQTLLQQSTNWRNHFDPDTRFMRPRFSNGDWYGNPYLAEMPDGWREGTGWQYTWLVPHDPAGLFEAMGAEPRTGERFVQQRLDEFFSLPGLMVAPHVVTEAQQKATLYGIAYYGNQYAPSNEHDLQAPWLYAFSSQQWKTDVAVNAYRGLYRPTPDGLPGNDDLGTMSAWFVWSAMGLYPTQAGAPVYTLTPPSFDRIEVRPAGGPSTTIVSPGATPTHRYLNGISIDGSALETRSVTQRQLAGATLEMITSPTPTALRADTAPPSASSDPLSRFDCVA